ncbi:MAG: hypothetical protein MJ246_03400 [Clostridia bacterium]|nr:hypothetical protein [Clostridia bacterium]
MTLTGKIINYNRRYLSHLSDAIIVEMPDGTRKHLFCDAYEVMGSLNFVTARIPMLFGFGDHCFYNHANMGDTVKISVSRDGYVKRIRPVL